MVRRVSNRQIMEKLEKIEKRMINSTVITVVFALYTLAIASFSFAFQTQDMMFFYMGLGVWVFSLVIFIWGTFIKGKIKI